MSVELLINVCEVETRVALVADGLLREVHLSREGSSGITGNIYLGRVDRVIPGMQAAFVDIGLERPGFLHARECLPRGNPGQGEARDQMDIRALLKPGQQVLVQVSKDPISTKGARLTMDLAIASRYLVVMPFSAHVGVSQRIADPAERERLRAQIEAANTSAAQVGFIARTAAEAASDAQIAADMRFLERLWSRLDERRATVSAPVCVFEELPVHIRMVRDVVSADVGAILIDEERTFRRVQAFVDQFLPEFSDRLVLHEEVSPLFARYGVEEELQRALDSEVPLRCGGSMIIEQTEAMTTVDVNTGAYVGGHDLEETVFRTNLEAAQALPRQLRLRNLGGIVVIDFIDMHDEDHQREVLRALERAVEADPARVRIEGFSALGLVQLSRKRTSDSLQRQVCEPCERCGGSGRVKSAAATSVEILRAVAQHARRQLDQQPGDYLIRADESVVDRLLDEDAGHLEHLSRQIGRQVRLQVEPCYRPGQYDLVLVRSALGHG